MHLAKTARSVDCALGWARLRLAVQRVGMLTGARRRPAVASAALADPTESDWDSVIGLCDGRLVLYPPIRR